MTAMEQVRTEALTAARDDLKAVLVKHCGHLSAIELLALLANLTGFLASMQRYGPNLTPEIALEVVWMNLAQEGGDAIKSALQKQGCIA